MRYRDGYCASWTFTLSQGVESLGGGGVREGRPEGQKGGCCSNPLSTASPYVFRVCFHVVTTMNPVGRLSIMWLAKTFRSNAAVYLFILYLKYLFFFPSCWYNHVLNLKLCRIEKRLLSQKTLQVNGRQDLKVISRNLSKFYILDILWIYVC